MKHYLLLFISLFSMQSVVSQDVLLHGIQDDGNPDNIKLVTLDAETGQVIDYSIIDQVNAYALGSSSFNQIDQNFIFLGVDPTVTFRLVSFNIPSDTIVHFPANQEGIYDTQFDMNSGKLYGLGNYIVDSVLIGPGIYQYEYAMRFMEVDPVSGAATELNKLPNFRGLVVGGSTFDANGGRYIANGIDSTGSGRIFVIDADDGSMISELETVWGPGEMINELEYNNNDNLVYGLYRNTIDGREAIASLNLETNELTEVLEIEDLQYFTPGASVFYQMDEVFIMYYIDFNNINRLMLVNVETGQMIATPQLQSYTTELQINNNQYAMLTYHNSVGLPENASGKLDVNVFPNPATSFINLVSEKNIQKIEIYDIQGRLVFHSESKAGFSEPVDISDLQKGTYIVKLQSNSAQTSKKLFVLF